jgi:hypothetical protein
MNVKDSVMFTEEEFNEFDRITLEESSRDQATRSAARLKLEQFKQKHGKAKCDAMWARIAASESNLKKIRSN